MTAPEVPREVAGRFASRQVARAAARLVDNLDSRRPGLLEQLRADPLAALHDFDELELRLTTDGGSRCSVLGRYDDSRDPPLITVVRSPSLGQTWFTALHELGHHEQRGDVDWFDAALARGSDPAHRLEEQVCEAFAADVLLGDDVAARVLGPGQVSAHSVAELRRATGASRSACCVRVAQLLGAPGFVLLGDLEGTVLFTALSGDRIRPAHHTAQGEQSVLTLAGRNGYARDDDGYLRYGNGRPLRGLRADAVRDGNYVYAVLTEGRAAWTTVDVGYRGPHWEPAELHCDCGQTYARTGLDMCEHCRTERCPACGRCACPPAAKNRICDVCQFEYSVARFDGDSTTCRDCA